ncbi:MAG: hypothetical protein Q9172_000943 [Xanthocarpia lactea]
MLVLVPQLAENYQAKNAQGVSLAFLAVWLVGDHAILILQCVYYNYFFARIFRRSSSAQNEGLEDPRQPLLVRQTSNLGLPGSRRRSSASQAHWNTYGEESLVADDVDKNKWSKPWVKNVLTVFGVCIVGAGAWAIGWKSGLWAPVHEPLQDIGVGRPVGAEVLGYISAVCYLGDHG